jgi:hypothetical protein
MRFNGNGNHDQQRKIVFNEQMSMLEINDTLHLKVSNVNETPAYLKFTL